MKLCTILLFLVFFAGTAQADWGPDPSNCSVWMEYSGPETVSLFVRPDGGGRAFTEAMLFFGGEVDASVSCQLIDYSGNPIANYPPEDLWLEPADGDLIPCSLGTCADTATDASGIATWSTPLHAGGASEGHCYVMVSGSALFTPLGLQFNSSDISGDLVVNLTDVSLFAENFYNQYHYRSDFYFDGILNLADLGMFAQSMGASCP